MHTIHRFPSILTVLAAAALLLHACQSSAPATGDSIGTVTREQDLVEQGASPEGLRPVDGTNPLFEGDTLKVSEGGEGLLDFGDKLVVRLFNDSQVGLISTSAPGTPLGVRLFLERGGFTGRLDEDGGQAVFETPGGANITVLGTQFFLVYNASQQMSTIGNYDGQVQLDTAAGIIPLQPGHYVDWPSGQMPGQQIPIPVTIGQFEQWARQDQSPSSAVERMRTVSRPAATMPILAMSTVPFR